MYKKIFSAILFGALTIASTSTFVSCKDYDDDIEYLQKQIDELVQSKQEILNTTIPALQKADADLQKAITDGDTKTLADAKAAAKELIDQAITDCQEACRTNLAASQAAQDAEFDKAITKVNQRIDDIVKLLSDQDGNLQQVGKDLKALSDKLSTFEAQYGNLTTAFTELTQRVTNLDDAVKAQDAALKDLSAKLSGQPGSNGYDDTALKNDIKGAQTRIDGIEQSVKDLQAQLTEKFNQLTEKLNNVSGDLNDLKQAHTDFATQVTNQLTELNNNISNVKAQAEKTAEELGALDVMFKILVNDLRSLVYMPKLYIDGIETIEYPYLKYALLHKTPTRAYTRWENDLSDARAPQNLGGEIYDLIDVNLNDSIAYGPVWPIQYHMNPGNASTEYANIKGYYAYEAEVLTRAFYDTKTNAAGTWGIVPADRWDNQYNTADMIWGKNNGIMTIGLQIKKPEGIDNAGVLAGTNHFPTDLSEDTNDDKSPESVKNVILALQANSKKAVADYADAGKDTVITSDYAQLVMEKVKIEGLIWMKNKTPKYWDNDNERIVDFWENKKGYGPAYAQAPTVHPQTGLPNTYGKKNPAGWDYGYRKGTQNRTMGRDTICPVTRDWIHVWASPEEALMHPADIELYINKPVSLVEHLGVHWYFEQNEPLTENVAGHGNGVNKVQTWAYNDKELQRYGFVWVFDTLDYFVDTNQTHDSRYIQITDHKTGMMEALNVRESGATYEDPSHTAVGREPLIRVRLYHFSNIKDMEVWQNLEKVGIKKFNDDNINASGNYAPVLDGYIRVHITRPELLEIDKYPTWEVTFDLCNDEQTKLTTWAQFSKWVLTDELDNMEKEQFDALYNVEQEGSVDDVNKIMELVQYAKPRTPLAEDDHYYKYKKLTDAPATWHPTKSNKDEYKIGKIYTRWDEVGTTNHIYFWRITAEEMESLTHHATGDQGENGVVITRYIHYTGHFYSSTDPNNAGAKYDDIFIKLSVKITRDNVPVSKTSKRDENYWYYMDGSWNRFLSPENNALTDAQRLYSIANNTPYPQDGLSNTSRTVPWRNDILRTWDTNKVSIATTGTSTTTKASKFYFAPIEYTITALDGTVYKITPRRGYGDKIYDKFICKYFNNNSHTFVYDKSGTNSENWYNDTKLQENNDILNKCAIRYQPLYDEVIAAYPGVATSPNGYANATAYAGHESEFPRIDGVFSNDTLFAYKYPGEEQKAEYEPIAIITNNSTGLGGGQVVLLHEYVKNKWLDSDDQPSGTAYAQANEWNKENAYAEACVNAVGYDLKSIERDPTTGLMTGKFEDHGNPIAKQLRSYVGVIATSNCNIANRMNDARTNMFTVFQMPWERPINILKENDFMVDAINNSDYIYLVDLIKLFDWRGASNKPTSGDGFDTGYMWGDEGIPSYWTERNWRKNQWLWAYYNVKAITVDLSPNKIKTNLSETDPVIIADPARWTKTMAQVSNGVELTAKGAKTRVTFKYPDFGADPNMPLRVSPQDYNAVSENQKLIEYMGLDRARQETYDAVKGKFGYIRYENNGQNVYDFDVLVPISVTYDWGEIFDEPIKIHIHYTRGN